MKKYLLIPILILCAACSSNNIKQAILGQLEDDSYSTFEKSKALPSKTQILLITLNSDSSKLSWECNNA